MKWTLLLFFLLACPVFADTTGTINFSTANTSVTTGLFGYTVEFCNSAADCRGMGCYLDYDNTSSGASAGWCNLTTTHCFHNNSAVASGTNVCRTNETYVTCSSSAWSIVYNCSTGYRCDTTVGTPGNCTAIPTSSSGSSSGGGSGGSVTTVQKTAAIYFILKPTDFDLIQGNSTTKYVVVKNTGNLTLYNITLSITGFTNNMTPVKIIQLPKNNEETFTITFSSTNATILGQSSVTITARTTNASVTTSSAFKITVKPTSKTVTEVILPSYDEYTKQLDVLTSNLEELRSSGVVNEELEAKIVDIQSKMKQAGKAIENKDYATAKEYLDNIQLLIEEANKISNDAFSTRPQADYLLPVIIILLAAFVGFMIYLLLPPPSDRPKIYRPKSWIKPRNEKKGIFDKLNKKEKKPYER